MLRTASRVGPVMFLFGEQRSVHGGQDIGEGNSAGVVLRMLHGKLALSSWQGEIVLIGRGAAAWRGERQGARWGRGHDVVQEHAAIVGPVLCMGGLGKPSIGVPQGVVAEELTGLSACYP